ncbi:hypothetical protein RO3G_06338 [Rhizopus delemar RA 99-880]|uniref:Uncharacterized protein n=1 Tax=Rhizopus delemar (strain RA 99-880 / ATCC MYA-4621 / FGSC 9543 / NRRL 43880) TaxID=246409 RepID=I1BZK3_RHIO9|nr:hypothetical protein RO3G_06338 [Rhizopus delemar RA 99-880]|eukprot:EIE81633.1 hypothetical protein RO3G_06338 [Rhizopus delemar RA 99-880]
MPQSFHQYIDEYIDSVDLTMAKKKIKLLSLLLAMDEEDDNDTANLEFLHQLLNQVHKSYASHVDYNSTECAFNQLFIWPYLDIIAKSIKADGCDSDFVQGQPILESMTQQLKAVNLYVDDKNQYKSDGLVKFDHHKGIYGALAMLKCIVDDCLYASIETFTKVKVFFLHAADTELHFWSVCYQKDGMFDFWRETNLKIKPDFGDKCDLVPELIQFCWETKMQFSKACTFKQYHQHNHTKVNEGRRLLRSGQLRPYVLPPHP